MYGVDMYQAKVYVDFDSAGALHHATRTFETPLDVLEEEVHDDGTISFIIDVGEHQETFVSRIRDEPNVSRIEQLDDGQLLIRKEARGATVAIRRNHGKLRGIDKVWGTKRIFEVVLLRHDDLRSMVAELREISTVRVESIVKLTGPPSVLSDRQHETLETALEMGYFEWPRRADIETVADTLDVTHSTALEHLRKAQRKLLTRALHTATTRTTKRDRQFLLDSGDR